VSQHFSVEFDENFGVGISLNEDETALVFDCRQKLIFVVKKLKQEGVGEQGSGLEMKTSF
jgi:hypothetical protein